MKNQVMEMLNKKGIEVVMSNEKVDRIVNQCVNEEFTARRTYNKLVKENNIELGERLQKPVKEITINIEWKRSATWGMNPHATANVKYADGSYQNVGGYTCRGCGYDKESTIIANIFNDVLKYRLWDMQDNNQTENTPYGIYWDNEFSPRFDKGIGVSCYYKISTFIGGKLERIASSKSFDCYKFTMN